MASTGTFLGTSKLCLVRLMSRYRHGDSAANTEKAFLLSCPRVLEQSPRSSSETGPPSCPLQRPRGHTGQHIKAGSRL